MNSRLPSVFLLVLLAAFGTTQLRGQTDNPGLAMASPARPAATSGQRIVTKDPEYLKLLNPPKENDFLKSYSKGFRDASAEISAKVADITDPNLHSQTFQDEWAKVIKDDGDKFQYEAAVAFHDAKVSYAQNHRDGWLVVGPVYYDENNKVLRVNPYPTAPIVANLRVPISPADLQKLYDKYHALVAGEIDRRAHEYVSKAGAGSNCSRIPDLCYKYTYQQIEQDMRTNRIVAVAQGDLETDKIDRLFLADYDTETVIQDLGEPSALLTNIAWRFSPGPLPAEPAQPAPEESAATAPQPSASSPASPATSPTQAATPASQTTPAPAATAAAQSSTDAPAMAKAPARPIVVPANVTAASIVTQTPPAYPAEARAKQIQGEVLLHAIIDKEGKISEVQVLSGDDLLAQAAVEAVRQWRYKPMLVEGEPREVDTTITVTFSLKN